TLPEVLKTAAGRGWQFTSFMLKQDIGIKAIQTLEGHNPEWSLSEFGKTGFSSFLAGAFGGPLAFGRRGILSEASAMAFGQVGANATTMAVDRGLAAWKGEEWAKANGFGNG